MHSSHRHQRGVAVVIGSGSVKCAAALGLVNVLNRAGIAIDMLVGCSAGCLYATMLASGRTTAEAAEMTKQLWTSTITDQHNRRAWLKAAFPRLFGFDARFGLRDDRLVMERLNAAFGDSRIEAMGTPLFLTATDFANGNQAVFSSGRAVDAIRASIAVPFLFSPWPIDGHLYIDGYMSDPLPVGVAMREGSMKPDLSTAEKFRAAMLAAKSIAYSDSGSGTFLSTTLFPKLGVADQVAGKSRKVRGPPSGEPVAAVVARGEAEIGFQQVSELLHVPGVTFVGPLPAELQPGFSFA